MKINRTIRIVVSGFFVFLLTIRVVAGIFDAKYPLNLTVILAFVGWIIVLVDTFSMEKS